MNTPDELIEVLQAYKEGKTIQYYTNNKWHDQENSPAQTFGVLKYRVKPEPPKRLECWSYPEPRGDTWYVSRHPISSWFVHLREVRPGDLTREEVIEKLEEFRAGRWNYPTLRRIFLGEDEA